MKRSISVMIVLAAVMLSGFGISGRPGAGPAAAQAYEGYEDDAGPGGGPGRNDEKREAVRKKVETIRMWRLTEALRLDESTGAKLAALLSSIDEQRRDLITRNREAISSLRRMLDAGKPDQARLKVEIDRMEQNHQAMQELKQREREGIRSMLTTEQQARYLVFQQDFRREMRGMIAGARSMGTGRNGDGREGPAR
jgi:Spy/CpxP family protein refolding chaperone